MGRTIVATLNKVEGSFYKAFLAEDRWKLYFAGLGVTLKVALFAAILGLVIGTVIALMKLSTGKKGKGTIWSFIANCYIDVGSAAVNYVVHHYEEL